MTTEEYRTHLLHRIYPVLIKKGAKNMTMDYVAKSLSISKRTLYEIFGSKEQLLCEALTLIHDDFAKRLFELTHNAGNMMETMAIALRLHQEAMREFGTEFFKAMDESYSQIRPYFEKNIHRSQEDMLNGFLKGVEEGVFRPNIDYRIIIRLFMIQMESLKRMEENFPPDVTLLEAYETASTALLRSIATPKGLEILEEIGSSHRLDGILKCEQNNE